METLDPSERRFWISMIRDDDLGAVVRTQTFLEANIEQLIRRNLTRQSDKLKTFFERVGYTNQVQLAEALGELDDWMARPLYILARLRNGFSHDPLRELTQDDVNGLYGSLENAMKRFADRYPVANPALTPAQLRLRTALVSIRHVIGIVLTLDKSNPTVRDIVLEGIGKPIGG
jgi:hypothetical protein